MEYGAAHVCVFNSKQLSSQRTRQLQQHPRDNDIRRQQRNAATQHSPSISFVVCVSCGSSKKSPSKTCSRGGRYVADALPQKRQMQTGRGACIRRQQLHCNVLCFEYMLPCEFVCVIACTPKNVSVVLRMRGKYAHQR